MPLIGVPEFIVAGVVLLVAFFGWLILRPAGNRSGN
jgi:hypothetical protein